MGSRMTDELLLMFAPNIVYWVYSGMYAMLGDMEKYRLHPKGDENKNVPSRSTVIKGVLTLQAMQIAASFVFVMLARDSMSLGEKKPEPSLSTMALQFLVAAVTMDTYQYFMHRFIHSNKFLNKIHSHHHSLVVPYAFGATYGHPLDGILIDISGSLVSSMVAGMTPRTSMYFFCFSTVKIVDDHCGLLLPWNPLQRFFSNNSAFHDVHHQLYGNKYNYSQPFFVSWDKLMGTYLPFTVEKREEGGFEVTPHLMKQA
ncbi:sphinganine C4-monooxygenase 1-like [Asparagus officinalis]|uniref:sphinganine C4-monooxygenase 1-like n=1 Tax=Asparagus officinalis TaxID=4686 RepID=UPI00098E1DAE|nr:sphinganine C4-monooxygenase 1-like [Asparagus officinalis]XP_020255065.1 sphinganine C4-monooxygenase 1-like [Asparagus officinalis]XP_020259605.1 sphinganine C4-monooxygenase 1-like [Asparagus officinalis]XP_020259606.1 sphinganine C4-monooxygenase 1-like [Asparagus officinalis]